MIIHVKERLVADRGLARRTIGGVACSDRTFYLVLAARAVSAARRELLSASSFRGSRRASDKAREGELLANASQWLALAQADRERARRPS